MLAGVLLHRLANRRNMRCSLDHVEEERTTHRRRRRRCYTPENVSDCLPLNGPLFIVAHRQARAYRVTVSIDSLHSQPTPTKLAPLSNLSWHAVQVARQPAKVKRDSLQTNVSYCAGFRTPA